MGRPVAAERRWQTRRRELGVGVQAGAHGRSAQGHFVQVGGRSLQAREGSLHLAGVPQELLAQADGRRVLQVRAPGLDDGMNSWALASSDARRALSAGANSSRMASRAAMWITVGITSLDDWPRLT